MAHNFARRRATTEHVVNERLPVAPNPSFRWMWHPESWAEANGVWLPRLKKWWLLPGVNGVKSRGPMGHLHAKTEMEAVHGFIVLDPVKTPVLVKDPDNPGQLKEERGYLDTIPCQRGKKKGDYHLDPWTSPDVLGHGAKAKVIEVFDHETFDAWRLMLVEKGIVERPHPATLNAEIDRQRSRAGRRIAEAHDGNPHVQAAVEAEFNRAERMEAAVPAALGLVPPEPKPKRKRGGASVQA